MIEAAQDVITKSWNSVPETGARILANGSGSGVTTTSVVKT
jgi:hypothetical protein